MDGLNENCEKENEVKEVVVYVNVTYEDWNGLLCLFCCLLIDIKENVKFPFIGKSLRTKNRDLSVKSP